MTQAASHLVWKLLWILVKKFPTGWDEMFKTSWRGLVVASGFFAFLWPAAAQAQDAAAIDSSASVRNLAGWTDAFWLDQFEDGALPGAGSADLLGFPREQGVIDIGAVEH